MEAVAPASHSESEPQMGQLETDFSLRHMKYWLTYPTHIPKDKLRKHLERLGPIKEFYACHESADERNPYEHTHCAVWFEKSLDYRRGAGHYLCIGKADTACGKIHGHYEWIKSTKADWGRVTSYMIKEDDECRDEVLADRKEKRKASRKDKDAGLKTLAEQYAEEPRMREAVGKLVSYTDVCGLIAAYNILYTPGEPIEPLQYEWQHAVVHWMRRQTERQVFWMCNKRGGIGKTKLAKHLCLNDPTAWAFCVNSQNAKDFASYIQTLLMRGWTGEYLCFDLGRTIESCIGIYNAIETLKNGMASTSKYQGTSLFFRSTKILVFANWWPDVDRLSKDRWVLIEAKGRAETCCLTRRHVRWVKAQHLLDETSSEEESDEESYLDMSYPDEECGST